MVQIRSISFVLTFFLLHIRDSCTAHTHQDVKNTLGANEMTGLEAAGSGSAYAGKILYDGVPTAAELEKTMLGGRKILSKRRLTKEIVKDQVLNQKDSAISGAAQSVGNCNHRRKGILNLECKLRNRRTSRPDHKVKMASFTAFSADYHNPKSHPPRNN